MDWRKRNLISKNVEIGDRFRDILLLIFGECNIEITTIIS